ncbi:FkbM family methyltransferase [Nitzschia inconspicua]|uniref:FkbM family methyltransferase n=1 Tax=Nitzschia inconspicua TaxID=303405 RepID=A0A9K3PLW3_9STRA|nr:FkbM family methyltransferase [Nitzschia inconspicua]
MKETTTIALTVVAFLFLLSSWFRQDYMQDIDYRSDLMAIQLPTSTAQSASSSSLQQHQASNTILLYEDLALSGYAAEVWEGLLLLQSSLKKETPPMAVVEVGMHRAKQCLQAAKMGFEAHCIEPSPKSFQHIAFEVNNTASPDVQKRIHLYNVAAGSVESTVPFVTSGGTGDHVGKVDMWKMEKMDDAASDATFTTTRETVVHVPVKPLDTILQHGIPSNTIIHLLKVDTQGFEPQVFAGLNSMLSQHRIRYILTEFWPRGMDILDEADSSTKNRKCIGVTRVLQKLLDYEYRLYVLPAEAHPKAPAFRDVPRLQKERPMDNLMKYCQWYYELEDRYPSDEYKMGYWTDILALAPGVELPETLRQLPVYVR